MTYQIFLSLRQAEAEKEGKLLKNALEAKGISTFLCAVDPGGDIKREIVNALNECHLAIILGTRTYGQDTRVGFSTFEELRFICKEKPFFLIKMCDTFEEPETRFSLPDSVSWFPWTPGSPMPKDLLSKIVTKLESVRTITSTNKGLVPSPPPTRSRGLLKSILSTTIDLLFDFEFRNWFDAVITFVRIHSGVLCGHVILLTSGIRPKCNADTNLETAVVFLSGFLGGFIRTPVHILGWVGVVGALTYQGKRIF